MPCHVCSSLAGVLPRCLQLEVGVLGDGVESGSEEVGPVTSLLTMGKQLGEVTPLRCSCALCHQMLQCSAQMLLHSALSGHAFGELVEAVLPVQCSVSPPFGLASPLTQMVLRRHSLLSPCKDAMLDGSDHIGVYAICQLLLYFLGK